MPEEACPVQSSGQALMRLLPPPARAGPRPIMASCAAEGTAADGHADAGGHNEKRPPFAPSGEAAHAVPSLR